MGLKGIGPEFAAVLWSEGLFRRFANRRQVAAYAGLAPTPWQSGSLQLSELPWRHADHLAKATGKMTLICKTHRKCYFG